MGRTETLEEEKARRKQEYYDEQHAGHGNGRGTEQLPTHRVHCFITPCTLFSVALMAAVAIVAAHEFSTFHACMIEKSDLINRDSGARVESVCVDPYKVSRFGHRFSEPCEAARASVDKGIILAAVDCFMSKHNVYQLLTFENTFFNYALTAGLFCTGLFALLMVKNYYVQVATIKATTNTHKEFLNVFKEHRRHSEVGRHKMIGGSCAPPLNPPSDFQREDCEGID